VERNDQLKKTKNYIHISFEIGLTLKAIDGFLEIIGGALLLFLNQYRLNKIIILLTQRELLEDPDDRIANWLLTFGNSYTISSQYFGVFYLISHGLIRLILVFLLWRDKLWAYPLAIILLIFFIAYQVYQFTSSHSVILIFLTVFDLIMIVLTIIEYKNKRKSLGNIKPHKAI
jgi:uncharacterized membrane protein